jgi:hypothetical protein
MAATGPKELAYGGEQLEKLVNDCFPAVGE